MASPSQITANRLNAKRSTGPVTSEGKSRSSQNSVKLGLFCRRDFVPPDCRDDYDTLRQNLLDQIRPATPSETVVASELVSAAWRLERCAQAEGSLDTSIDFLEHLPTIAAIDRARASAERSFHRSIAELRKLQTERCSRLDEISLDDLGLAEIAKVARAFDARTTALKREAKRAADQLCRDLEAPAPDLQNEPNFEPPAKRTQSEPAPAESAPALLARSAPCPCGSGRKYKRCCGVDAPPLPGNLAASRTAAAA